MVDAGRARHRLLQVVAGLERPIAFARVRPRPQSPFRAASGFATLTHRLGATSTLPVLPGCRIELIEPVPVCASGMLWVAEALRHAVHLPARVAAGSSRTGPTMIDTAQVQAPALPRHPAPAPCRPRRTCPASLCRDGWLRIAESNGASRGYEPRGIPLP